jgi:prophage antirepressor-like protein
MTSLTVFEFESNCVRFVGTLEQPEWIAQDVCDILDNGEARNVMRDFDHDEKGVYALHTLGGEQNVLTVTEPGLYRLIFKSRKPIAKKFQRWVFHEVLPQIRKTGRYEAPAPQEPTYLPPLKQAREAIDIAKDYKEIFGAINPQIEQHLKDLIGNTLIQFNQLAPTSNKECWMGVVNYAEVEMGYYVSKKGEHRDSALGRWVKFYHPHLSNRQERRLCNETQRDLWVYPVHEVGAELAKAISEFFAHPAPSTKLKQDGAFKRPLSLVNE